MIGREICANANTFRNKSERIRREIYNNQIHAAQNRFHFNPIPYLPTQISPMSFQAQPILRDFSRFLTFLGQSGSLELTRDKGLLRSADLQQLNEQMHWKARMNGPKSQQPAYAVLNLFFHIARAAGLAAVSRNQVARKNSLSLVQARVGEYRGLTPDEQYFFLLESFWCYLDWKEVFECFWFTDKEFYLKLAKKPAGRPIALSNPDFAEARNLMRLHNVRIAEVFEAFGWIQLEWDERMQQRPGKFEFPYQSVAVTPLGNSIFPVLFKKRSLLKWSGLSPYANELTEEETGSYEDEEFEMDLEEADGLENLAESLGALLAEHAQDDEREDPYETPFAAAFLPAFEGLAIEKSLYPIVRTFIEGKFIFKVEFSTAVYRVIALDSNLSLEDLHLIIQELFRFDDDHLYAFFMDGESWSRGESYYDPRGLDDFNQIPADAVRIGELGLSIGQIFLYLFDFGDEWHFHITLLAVEPADPGLEDYQLIESVGAAPEQY